MAVVVFVDGVVVVIVAIVVVTVVVVYKLKAQTYASQPPRDGGSGKASFQLRQWVRGAC